MKGQAIPVLLLLAKLDSLSPPGFYVRAIYLRTSKAVSKLRAQAQTCEQAYARKARVRVVASHPYPAGIRYIGIVHTYTCITLCATYITVDPPILTLANFSKGAYRFSRDLLALESASPTLPQLPYPQVIASPLRPEAWERTFQAIPDKALTSFLRRGIHQGFRIGVAQGAPFKPAKRNLKSASEQPDTITAYIQREVDLGRMGPLPRQPALTPPLLQISPFGVIPKKNRPDKWRLIVDLSSPEGHSINDAISKDLCGVVYTSVDQAVTWARALGRGCLLAKLDLKEAYRAVPIHPSDQRLLAVSWKDTLYLDRALPFGLRSAPKIFSALTDAMMWTLHGNGVEWGLHYLDDFLVLGPPGQQTCQDALGTTLRLCAELGFPVAAEKTEGPATVLTFLGIELDTVKQEVRLPQDKLSQLSLNLAVWMKRADSQSPRGSCKKRELLSLIGHLSHAAKVVKPGRAFLRSLIDASSSVRDLSHWVHLNKGARADIAWWHTFLRSWNGTSMMQPSGPPLAMVSDASGSWGCGAAQEDLWFHLQWPESWATVSIAPKELVPIVVAVVLWGPYWAGRHVVCLCDNSAVVAAVNKGAARDPTLSHLLRILALEAAVLDVQITARHLPGVQNASADALSRNKMQTFFSLNPQASPIPSIIPPELQELVLNRSLLWTSPAWISLLGVSWIKALRLPPARPIGRHSADMRNSARDMGSLTHTP